MGNHPTKEQILSFYQEALRTATTWPNFLAKLALMTASYDGYHSWGVRVPVWTRNYDSNIHYAYIFMMVSQDYNLILNWHSPEGIIDRDIMRNVERIALEIFSRDNKNANIIPHKITVTDTINHKLNLEADTYNKLRRIIVKAYEQLPKEVVINIPDDQELIGLYSTARQRSSNLREFLNRLIEGFTIDIDGLRRPRYIGLNYYRVYFLLLDMLNSDGLPVLYNNVEGKVREDFIKWHRGEKINNIKFIHSEATADLIINMIP